MAWQVGGPNASIQKVGQFREHRAPLGETVECDEPGGFGPQEPVSHPGLFSRAMSEAPNLNHLAAHTLIGSLAHLGVRHAAVTPGSRNTPVAWQIAEEERMSTWIHHDERSAAFFGVGIGKSTATPAILSCTSGTAAAEYLPAVVEAHHSRTPLIVLTADRPPELRNTGAPQTIDQTELYGTAVRWYHDPGVPQLNESYMASLVEAAADAWKLATAAPAGPVHLNLPFGDPLAPDHETLPPLTIPEAEPDPSTPDLVDDAAFGRIGALVTGRRVVVVAGPGPLPPSIVAMAERHGWPLIADPLSGLRGTSRVVTEYGNAVARLGLLDGYLQPEAVLRFGGLPTSKALTQWLQRRTDIPQVLIHDGLWREPEDVDCVVVDPAAAADAIRVGGSPEAWLARWRAVRATIASTWQSLPPLSEPWIARLMGSLQSDDDDLWVASSMPVRDVDDFFGDRGGRVFGHRGANGIDGLISAAVGSALASGRRTRVLTGDLSLVHDMSAIGTGVRLGARIDIVVIDNDGGGIFHFLPQARFPRHFETLLGTPHGMDLASITAAYGADSALLDSDTAVTRRLWDDPEGVRVTVVTTDRVENAALHRQLWERLEKAFA